MLCEYVCIRLWVCVFAYIPINACPMFIAYVWRGLSKAISIPPTAELVACVAPHHTHTLTWGSFPLVLTLKRIMLGCLIWTVISRCKAYYCIGFTQQAVQPPPEWSLSSRRHIRALRKCCFSPSGLKPAGIKRSRDSKFLSPTRPAPHIVRTRNVVMEVVVYQQPELLAYYSVCFMCPCRSQRKQPVMQMGLLRKRSGLSSRRGEIEAASDRETGRCSRIEELM